MSDTPATPPGKPASLPAGRVGRPHGLDGSFYVTGAKPRLLRLGAEVSLAGAGLARIGLVGAGLAGHATEIVRLSGVQARPILRLRGIEDRTAIEALRGIDLMVAQSDAPALADGEWWAHELEGCEVLDGERSLGTVKRLLELPSCEALEVAPADGGELLLVPMVKDAIRRVEPSAGRIEVDLDFLGLDADAPARVDSREDAQ